MLIRQTQPRARDRETEKNCDKRHCRPLRVGPHETRQPIRQHPHVVRKSRPTAKTKCPISGARGSIAEKKRLQFQATAFDKLIDFTGIRDGGASRARTDDLIVANDALSQLSYSPLRRRVYLFDFISRRSISPILAILLLQLPRSSQHSQHWIRDGLQPRCGE